MEANKITLKTVVLSGAAVLGMETVFRLVSAGPAAASWATLGLLRCLESAVLVYIVRRFEKTAAAVGLAPADMLQGIKKGVLWSVCFGIAAGLLFLVLFAAGIDALKLLNTPLPSGKLQLFIFFLVGGVLGPVWEELFFRGILYGFFRRWGVYVALATSTLLFVFPHRLAGGLPITQVVGGVVLAIAYEKADNLMAPLTIHCSANMAIFSLALAIPNPFFICA
jgi:membrane protease YdiL (CAAX protease family)